MPRKNCCSCIICEQLFHFSKCNTGLFPYAEIRTQDFVLETWLLFLPDWPSIWTVWKPVCRSPWTTWIPSPRMPQVEEDGCIQMRLKHVQRVKLLSPSHGEYPTRKMQENIQSKKLYFDYNYIKVREKAMEVKDRSLLAYSLMKQAGDRHGSVWLWLVQLASSYDSNADRHCALAVLDLQQRTYSVMFFTC